MADTKPTPRNNALPLSVQIRVARDKKGWTQTESAERLKISFKSFSRLERGHTLNPTPKTRAALKRVLGINANSSAPPPPRYEDLERALAKSRYLQREGAILERIVLDLLGRT